MHTLHNNHNVYILGAGFSALRGLPTVANFMFAMRDAHPWLKARGREKEADAIASVLDFRLNAASAAYRIKLDLENIEELFSLASASSRTLTQKIQLAIAATLDYKLNAVRDTKLNFSTPINFDRAPAHWEKNPFHGGGRLEFKCSAYEFFLNSLLGNWGSSSNLTENSFITFNYDLLVEEALAKLSLPFTYGFGSEKEGVEVLKLHGSVNWAKKEGSTTSYIKHNSYEDLLKNQQTPQLVPPTWRKIFTGPLRQIWDRSLNSLEKATRIIVIGFSIPPTDNHFKYLMAAGLQNNISLREIVFVNPASVQLEQRANALFGDISNSSSVKFISSTLESFVSQGTIPEAISNYGRLMPNEIQNIYLSN